MTAVDVYSESLNADAASLDHLYETLSAEERERVSRFRLSEHRRHYIACRGMLREILSPYLGIHPSRVAFSYNRYGKPSVPGSDIRFNVSHSSGWAMFAVTHGREVGIDVEFIDARFVREQIPERFFFSARGGDAARADAGAANRCVLPLLDSQGGVHQSAGAGTGTGAR